MPGLHLYCDLEGGLGRRGDLALRASESLVHDTSFKLKTLVSSRGIFLGATYHKAYPVVTFENDEFFICLEGRIYGMSEPAVDSSLAELAGSLYPGGIPCIPKRLGRVASWVLGMDGDFVIVVQHRATGHVTVINDSLGRLPLFIFRDRSRLMISRELRFVTSMLGASGPETDHSAGSVRAGGGFDFDRTGLAHYLLFGFMPGGRTFISGVRRLGPASVVRAGRPGTPAGPADRTGGGTAEDRHLVAEVSVESLRTFDFGIRKNRGKDIEIASADMVDLFLGSAADRAVRTGLQGKSVTGPRADGINVLAMSGGLDSRCVAAALASQGIGLEGATFLDHFRTASADVDIAREIAETLGIPWRLFEPGQASGRDVLRLLRAKSGDNFLGMSFSVPLFDSIRAAYGDKIHYFTGEGGGLTVPDCRPYMRTGSVGDLTGHLIERNSILSPRQISEIMGVSEGEVFDSVAAVLDSYPETEMADRYTHFIVRERNLRWTFDAEDRNRFWFWTVSPFQSPLFFDYVMNCPDEMKRDYGLYRKFLLKLSPEAAAIKNVNWNAPLGGNKYRLYLAGRRFYYRMPAPLKSIVRRKMKNTADVVGPYAPDSPLMRCFADQNAACPRIGDYLSASWVNNLLPTISKYGFDHIFTMTSLIEDLLTGRSTLERYLDSDLI